MTTMKDKLAASVRQAKSAQQAGTKKPAQPAAKRAAATSKVAAKPAAASKPVAPKAAPAAKPAAKPAAPGVHAGGIPDSTTTLHPQRVWPD
ncbi:MAG: hypothetical protein B7Y26_08170 [Hydrogenophilales bacterium 16-64-46]|nr:MAG: hypothetical protein B7Z32_03525 [Hydrogenophilales bacterium 12-64-13]OYZ05245.1 MAG: hypothetical protein B7Y26_08170 [Hydrogenophilales bacterium 16-64-46]OZA37059.1 MAG: hypothetical protein B7X87_12215 [Hydrogenophilales bacterium 17-64-34]HQT01287.1 hypothetical protein [Thiobacillus sp.]